MIPNHLIRQEMQKKKFLVAAEIGGERENKLFSIAGYPALPDIRPNPNLDTCLNWCF